MWRKKKLEENEFFSLVWIEKKIQKFRWKIECWWTTSIMLMLSKQCEVREGGEFFSNFPHNFMRKILSLVSNNFSAKLFSIFFFFVIFSKPNTRKKITFLNFFLSTKFSKVQTKPKRNSINGFRSSRLWNPSNFLVFTLWMWRSGIEFIFISLFYLIVQYMERNKYSWDKLFFTCGIYVWLRITI